MLSDRNFQAPPERTPLHERCKARNNVGIQTHATLKLIKSRSSLCADVFEEGEKVACATQYT